MVMKEIFYYVRNNVDYEPYLGVMAGPNWTLLQGAGNSFDQALLLSSLLRESGIQTRYVYGKIVPLDPSFKLYEYVAGLESPLLNLTSTSNLLNETIILSDSELQNRTFTQVFGYWKLQKESPPLNHSLPYKVTSSTKSSVIPEEYYHKARFKLVLYYCI